MLRRTATVALTALAGTLLLALPAQPAQAALPVNEVYERPADGVFRVDGHGWGHGRGLNQYGAHGAGQSGRSYTEILSKYYPGTAAATIANTNIRVLLEDDDEYDVIVRAAANLALRDNASGARYVLPTNYSSWRVSRGGDGLFRVQGYSGGWQSWGAGGRTAWTGFLQFEGASPLRLLYPDRTERDYRGVLRAVVNGRALATVNVLPMEQYLWGVVPRESISSFHIEALKSQAVAARSYSAYKRAHAPSTAQWDICSTTSCQVYGGIRVRYPSGTTLEQESARATSAVNSTANQVRTYGGKPIFAEYSSSNGGWSTSSTNTAFPYLRAQADPWDEIASPHHDWTATITAAQIEAKYPSVGRLLRIKVTERDGNGEWGGRVRKVVLEGVNSAGTPTSVASSGGGIYSVRTWPAFSDGLRGTWWKIRPTAQALAGTVVRVAAGAVVRPGHTTPVYFDVRNTGTEAWPKSHVRSGLNGSDSPSYDESTWATPQRPGAWTTNLTDPANTTSVSPGQVARFAFTIAGNGRPEGDYTETFGVVWETRAWLDLSVTLPYRVQLLFAGELAGVADPVVVPGLGTARTHFDVKNVGDMAWPLSGPIHSTASGSPSVDESWLNAGRPGGIGGNVTRPGATEVAVGEVARFPLVLDGNGRAATGGRLVTEHFGIVWERRAHAALRAGVRYEIKSVLTGEYTSRPAGVLLLPSNGVATVTFEVENTGNLTWPLRGPVRVSARYGSPSRAPSWLSSTRPGHLVANVTDPAATGVGPGQVGRFSFELAGNGRTPGTAGTESFGVALDGVGYVSGTVTVSYEVRRTLAGAVVHVTSPVTVPRHETALMYVDVRNDGVTSWPVRGMVRLTVPSGSPSYNSTWPHSQRPAAITWNRSLPAKDTVDPGEIARFAVRLAGNGRADGTTATEWFGMVYERVGYVPVRVPVRYTVRDVFAGSVVGTAPAGSIPRTGTGRLWFDVRNTGNISWPVGAAVNSAAATSASRAPSWLNAVRPGHLTENRTTAGATVVRPGEVARFSFDVAGNGRPAGAYAEDFRVVWERRFWLPAVARLRWTIA